MARPSKNALLLSLYAAAALLVAFLLLREFGHSRFDDCMSVGAFSKSACEDYARE
jgi:hypothetical protein